jgi:hypothetical protein
MWVHAWRLGAAAAGAAATQGISGRAVVRGGCHRGGGDEYGSAGMLRAGGGPWGLGRGLACRHLRPIPHHLEASRSPGC